MSRGFVAALAFLPIALSAQTISYVDSSTPEKLEARVDVGVEQLGFGLNADMRLIGEHGTTQVLPRITSSWTTLEFLHVKTVFVYPDLNTVERTSAPELNTNVLVYSELPFLERVEATLRRAEQTLRNDVNVRFAPISTSFDLLGGRPLGVRTDLTLRDENDRRSTSSRVISTWGVGRSLDIESALSLDQLPGGDARSAIDTKLAYASSVPFVDRLEGRIRRDDGGRTQSLAILLPELAAGAAHGTSFNITGKAVVEQRVAADGGEIRKIGFETRLVAAEPPLLGGRSALSLKLERGLGADGVGTSSLAYDHAWSPSDAASIGLNLKMLRDADALEPFVDLVWSTRF